MNILHTILMVVQFVLAVALIAVVTSQTSKDQGLGGAFGGGESSGSRYSGGFEERLDNLAKNLCISFLVISFFVAWIGHSIR